jgi:hypothetical protein
MSRELKKFRKAIDRLYSQIVNRPDPTSAIRSGRLLHNPLTVKTMAIHIKNFSLNETALAPLTEPTRRRIIAKCERFGFLRGEYQRYRVLFETAATDEEKIQHWKCAEGCA